MQSIQDQENIKKDKTSLWKLLLEGLYFIVIVLDRNIVVQTVLWYLDSDNSEDQAEQRFDKDGTVLLFVGAARNNVDIFLRPPNFLWAEALLLLLWILLKFKLDEYGDVLKNKAKLVSKGYRQEEGIDFEESFAPDRIRVTLIDTPRVDRLKLDEDSLRDILINLDRFRCGTMQFCQNSYEEGAVRISTPATWYEEYDSGNPFKTFFSRKEMRGKRYENDLILHSVIAWKFPPASFCGFDDFRDYSKQDKCTDKSKITRKQSKASKPGHENQEEYKAEARKDKALAHFLL
ncbi:hypothetical protein Tco_1352094 [Tanacetum coccineum]